ncbi:uncharacterized [Tachysurus ichikawai]
MKQTKMAKKRNKDEVKKKIIIETRPHVSVFSSCARTFGSAACLGAAPSLLVLLICMDFLPLIQARASFSWL